MSTGPVRVSYLRTVGETGVAAWEISVGSAGSVEVGGTSGSLVPWPREGGLARCQEDDL